MIDTVIWMLVGSLVGWFGAWHFAERIIAKIDRQDALNLRLVMLTTRERMAGK